MQMSSAEDMQCSSALCPLRNYVASRRSLRLRVVRVAPRLMRFDAHVLLLYCHTSTTICCNYTRAQITALSFPFRPVLPQPQAAQRELVLIYEYICNTAFSYLRCSFLNGDKYCPHNDYEFYMI